MPFTDVGHASMVPAKAVGEAFEKPSHLRPQSRKSLLQNAVNNMRIVSYNFRFGGSGRVQWREVFERLQPDILLAQECSPPEDHMPPQIEGQRREKAIWAPVESRGGTLNWGSALFVERYLTVPVVLPDYSGWVVGGEIEEFHCPDGRICRVRAFSLHAPTAQKPVTKVVNAILDMLLDQRDGCDIVIGGDFNLTVGERHHSESRTTEEAHRKIQARLRDEFGLINCWQAANPDLPLAQTLRWNGDRASPYHCDGIFVPQSWEPHLETCSVLSDGLWEGLSDHNPVVAEFKCTGRTSNDQVTLLQD